MERHPLDGWVMVICNPLAGGGVSMTRLPRVERALRAAGVPFACEQTTGRGDATRLARSAVLSGCSAVVALGGDGTFFEIVNGMMSPTDIGKPLREGVAAGLIQAGRGSDFGRSAGVPADVDSACARLLSGRTQLIDLGWVDYVSFRGEERSRYFVNAAGIGFDAEVTARANAAPRVLGGTVPYLTSLLTTLWKYRNKHLDVVVDADEKWTARVNSLIVSNGQYFGGGMRIAPDARLADGQFDVVVLGDLGKIDLVRNVPRVYDGSHVTHPKVRIFRASEIEAISSERAMLQADGELLGTAPVHFTLVPRALRLIV